MATMLTFSTDHLPVRDRFEYWREEWSRQTLGLEIDIEPDRRPNFSAYAVVSALDTATVLKNKATACSMRRSDRTIDPSPNGGLHIYHVIRGGGTAITARTTEHVGPGAITSAFTETVGAYRPDLKLAGPNDLNESWSITIPTAGLIGLPSRANLDALCQHAAVDGLDVLLRSYVAVLAEQVPHLSGSAAGHAVRTLAQLTLGARGLIDVRDEVGTAAIRDALLVRAHRLIECELHRPDLGPARVAAQLGVSVRKLHLLFEPSGETFSRHVLGRRLARADRLLREMPQMAVTQAAFATGFENLSTFFRCYRAAYGATPGERRSEAGRAKGG